MNQTPSQATDPEGTNTPQTEVNNPLTGGIGTSIPSAGGVADPGLRLRRRPSQPRGVATFERILTAAADILRSGGIEALSTNLVASQSGVNISSIYKFFPNKQAIIAALHRRNVQSRVTLLQQTLEGLSNPLTWEQSLRQSVRLAWEGHRSAPAGAALRRAMQASPELQELDSKANRDISLWIGERLQALTRLSGEDCVRVARLLIETATHTLDLAEQLDDPGLICELENLLVGYLRHYVTDAPTQTRNTPAA
jgi:AcrR family transcriptional regulator